MNPHTHFLFPFFIATILVKFNVISWELAVICGVIGVLVDIDHYIEQIIYSKTNRFSLKATWNNAVRFHRFNQRSFIHYSKGAIILTIIFLVIAIFNWQIALVTAIGYYSHLILDYSHLRKPQYFNWKLGPLYMKESHLEIALDILLIIGLIVVILT